jgi:3-methyl-2-oxobutanoate hydroxymethyltransferase
MARTAPRKTLLDLRRMHDNGEKIAMLTCYDAAFTRTLEGAGVDSLLIGDSLGMVMQGHDLPIPVTLDDMVYHTACVARASTSAFILSDLSFGTSQVSPEATFSNAVRLLQAGAQMVKIEGGAEMAPTVEFMARRGVAVCAHVGLTPQSAHVFGGFRVQGKNSEDAARILEASRQLEAAGAHMLLMEGVPRPLADAVCEAVRIPTIGIGASPACSGQVLVLHDMLDVPPGRKARFVRNFMAGATSIPEAISAYVAAVKDGSFPAAEHCYPAG